MSFRESGESVVARQLYTLILYLLTPVILLRLGWRSRKAPAYAHRWRERFGFVKKIDGPVIWVHSVSVGETLAAVPLIKNLQTQFPEMTIAVTTMTPTGSERVTSLFGDSVYHSYIPYDLPDAINRFLQRVRPKILIIMETELWPNLIRACHSKNIPVVLANARLSEKSAAGYEKGRWLLAPMLTQLSAIAAQTEDDAQRFLSLGVNPQGVSVTGNIKFDLTLTDDLRYQAEKLSRQWQGSKHRPVWLAASTHAGEDELILDAFAMARDQLPKILLVLVPRHPERFDEVAELCAKRGFSVARRSHHRKLGDTETVSPNRDTPVDEADVILGDTMGELLMFCGASDLVFVGGSLMPIGGHNVIEPAIWGKPVLSGPYVFNFTEATNLLLDAGAMIFCEDAEALGKEVMELLADFDRNSPGEGGDGEINNSYNKKSCQMGLAALAVTESNRGALERLESIIVSLVPQERQC